MSDSRRREPRRNDGNFHVTLTEDQLNADRINVDMQQYANIGAASRLETGGVPSRNPQTQREQQREAREHRKRNRVKARKNRRIFTLTWIVMVVLVSLTIASYLVSGANDFLAVDRIDATVEVTLPETMTSEELADILYNSHVIEKPEFFSLYCGFRTEMEYFPTGTVSIATNLDYEDIINKLQAGPDMGEEITITFREGITVTELAELFEEEGFYTAEEILEYCNSDAFDEKYESLGLIPDGEDRYYRLEGYLFPDTYNFFENDTIDALLSRFFYNFENRLSDELREGIRKSGYSIDEIITLASIIQAEAANTDDMGMISAILHNRLENGASHDIFSLDCDSTMYYPYRKSTAPEGFVSSYSTYASLGGVTGLPAGPICNPGLDAITAAVFPSEEGAEYYYFCHDENGTPYYARTVEEHDENRRAAGLL